MPNTDCRVMSYVYLLKQQWGLAFVYTSIIHYSIKLYMHVIPLPQYWFAITRLTTDAHCFSENQTFTGGLAQ